MKNENLLSSLDKDSLYGISEDIMESAMDVFIENPILKEIPIIKSINALYKQGKSIEQYFFSKKILLFLFEANKVSQKERDAFYKVEENRKDREHLGEKLLSILSKIDDKIKAKLIGKLFQLYVKQKVSKLIMLDVLHIIVNIKTHYIELLQNCELLNHKIDEEILNHFKYIGIYNFKDIPSIIPNSKRRKKIKELSIAGNIFINEIIEVNENQLKKNHIDYLFNSIDKSNFEVAKSWYILKHKKDINQMKNQLETMSYENVVKLNYLTDYYDESHAMIEGQLWVVETKD